jgi:hypothetical protein
MKKDSKAEQTRKELIGKGINDRIINRGKAINDSKRDGKQKSKPKVYA